MTTTDTHPPVGTIAEIHTNVQYEDHRKGNLPPYRIQVTTYYANDEGEIDSYKIESTHWMPKKHVKWAEKKIGAGEWKFRSGLYYHQDGTEWHLVNGVWHKIENTWDETDVLD